MKTKKYTVDELIDQARREEREACAVVAEGRWIGLIVTGNDHDIKGLCEQIAWLIRARSDENG